MATVEHIKAYTSYLLEFIQWLTGEAVPWSSPSERATPWWTQEIQDLVQESRRLRRHKAITGDLLVHSQWLEIEKAKRRHIAWNKRRSFREAVQDAADSPEGVWRFARWAREKGGKPPELPIMPDLDTPEGPAKTIADKALVLRRRFYPQTEADLSDIQDHTFAPDTFMDPLSSEKEASKDKVRSAIRAMKPWKAPGHDRVPAGFLKAMGEPLVKAIAGLTTLCWSASYYPERFRLAKTIALKKPGKATYSALGS